MHRARNNKNDEFYTQLKDIEKELRHYEPHFKGQVVYCNCDDPQVSNFFKYFSDNFERLGLKKLIASCYRNKDANNRTEGASDKAVWLEYTGERSGEVASSIGLKAFEGDGDFRSEEVLHLLKEADIVVTNPPFSLFREYVAQLIKHDKKFVILGNMNAITYKDIFTLIKEEKLWLGCENGQMEFELPEEAEMKASASINKDGKKVQKFGNISWYTNLDITKRHKDLELFRHYDPERYPIYDNYDAINVNKVVDIPMDYAGVMGVPITFLSKHNPDQFDIFGMATGRSEFDPESHPKKKYLNPKQINKDGTISNGGKINTRAMLGLDCIPKDVYYIADNADKPLKSVYARILVKNRKVFRNPACQESRNAKGDGHA